MSLISPQPPRPDIRVASTRQYAYYVWTRSFQSESVDSEGYLVGVSCEAPIDSLTGESTSVAAQ